MITLSKGGVYLIGGTEVVETGAGSEELLKNKLGDKYLTKEDAAKNTMAYGILNEHNTSGNMDKLQIKFDKLTSHDITFVGIIQTARASGLEKFPIPYVLTNCHNSYVLLVEQLTKMTICLDLHVLRNMAEFMYHLTRQLFISLPERC